MPLASSSMIRSCVMKIGRFIFFVFLCFGLWLGALSPVAFSSEVVDHGLYGELLERYVHDGVVDYKGFKKEENRLDQYLKVLESTDTTSLSRDERFAFYINAYNAWTIKLILGSYPGVKSIKDLGGFVRSPWKKKICRIDGELFSLDHIEHSILRPEFGDPRVHFAINCASRSCPPLRPEPYTGNLIDVQLNEMSHDFINSSAYYMLDGNTLRVSRIFKWYSEDFGKDVSGFFRQYAEGDLKKRMEAAGSGLKIKYLAYDWSLNGS